MQKGHQRQSLRTIVERLLPQSSERHVLRSPNYRSVYHPCHRCIPSNQTHSYKPAIVLSRSFKHFFSTNFRSSTRLPSISPIDFGQLLILPATLRSNHSMRARQSFLSGESVVRRIFCRSSRGWKKNVGSFRLLMRWISTTLTTHFNAPMDSWKE
jgi:hypothetical protein